MNPLSLINKLGPGLMYAAAAIGVSHLVQSTRAGAQFGFIMAVFILFSNLIKYPFFEIGPRYVAATGNNLLHGYKKLGNWAIILFMIMTLATMFIIQAAVTIVSAGLIQSITQINIGPHNWSLILLGICFVILFIGKFSVLDKIVKIIIIVLTLTTIISVTSGAFSNYHNDGIKEVFSFGNTKHLIFLAALMGWMPAPLDISVWHSIWAQESNKQNKHTASLKSALFDFKLGFIGTAILALGFLALGSMVMYGSGVEFSGSAVKFASQLIALYTKNLGDWSYPLIAIASFTTMFSTTLTCLDAFPRVINESVKALKGSELKQGYSLFLIITIAGTLVLLYNYLTSMKSLIDLATTISFVIAPVLAILNFMVINHKDIPTEFRQSAFLKKYSIFGIVFLSLFSIGYLVIK
ncbi:MAG: Mn2+/Fe2+ NRAMP family transporter [Thermoproteota archaeon]|jgi:Mn2+/Fe2+ NRAMP family transporter